MQVNIRQICGAWDLGYALDKHTVKSVYLGDNEYGHPQYETTRSPAGEALFQLKYRQAYGQAEVLAVQMAESLAQHFQGASYVIPMPPSRHRARQPVIEIATHLAGILGLPCVQNLLVKTGATPQMKDIAIRQDKIDAPRNALTVHDVLPAGQHDILIVDDLF